MRHARLLAHVAGTPWAIDPVHGRAMLDVLLHRARGAVDVTLDVSAEELEAKLHPSTERSLRRADGGVQVIPIQGVMGQHMNMMMALCGGTSSDLAGRQISAAARDPDVKAIMLHVESPGGSVYGIQELADRILEAREVKPVIAHVDSYAASAAYWAASQATEVVVAPGGDVGSIGVYSLHEDVSKALEAQGVTPTFISAGPYKVEGNPYEPLTDEARATLQSRVDLAYKQFLATVARGRGRDVDEVEERFGQGRMVDAEQALRRGMVDRIGTFEETLARLFPSKQERGRRAESWDARRAAEGRALDLAERT